MKKLLLIALTIPNFALAENFKLVCEGQTSKFRNDALEKTYKTTQVIEVNDDFIVQNNLTKSTMKLFFEETEFKKLLTDLEIDTEWFNKVLA